MPCVNTIQEATRLYEQDTRTAEGLARLSEEFHTCAPVRELYKKQTHKHAHTRARARAHAQTAVRLMRREHSPFIGDCERF
jgi:hypothetical protein